MIMIEKAKNRIHLRSTRPTAGVQKTVPGATFNKGTVTAGGPYWSMPLSLTGCQALRQRFGQELTIGPELWAWARAEISRNTTLKTLASARDAELVRLPAVAPVLAAAMEKRTYQRVGARFIAEARACLIGDQPGLGKTLEALGGIVEADCGGPYLVVTPKTAVQSVWAREIPRWLGKRSRVVTVPDGRAARDKILDDLQYGPDVYDGQPMADTEAALEAYAPLWARTWVVVHPEMVRTQVWWVCGVCGQETRAKAGKVVLGCQHEAELRRPNRVAHTFPQLFDVEWGAIICDESDRSLLRQTGTPTQTRCGMERLPVRADGLKIALSGTPFRGRPHLLWGTLNWLDPEAHPAFWSWCERYWTVTAGQFGGRDLGELHNEEALWASLDAYVLRRTKEEAAPDMPAKTYAGTPAYGVDGPIGVWLPMEPAQKRMYDEMLKTSVATLESGEELSAVGVLAEMTRLKQFAGSAGVMVRKTKRVMKASADQQYQEARAALASGGLARLKRKDFEDEWAEVQGEPQFEPSLPSNKFDYVVQLLTELGYPDDPSTKVVIASQFTSVLDLFAAELPGALQKASDHPRTPLPSRMRPRMLTGAVTGKARETAIDEMNAPLGKGAHILLLNTKAGGVAITLDTADVMVILDETWIPDDQEQLEDRIHRVSNPRPVTYYYLRSLDSIDLGIALVNETREYATKRLLDGRRGIAYGKAIMDRTKGL